MGNLWVSGTRKSCEPDRADDLATLNAIIATLNHAPDVHSALDDALEQIVDLMGLEGGMVYLREPSNAADAPPATYRLAAHRGLPPELLASGADAWGGRCRCQQLCEAGELTQAVNIVGCSRLAALGGNSTAGVPRVHASVALRSHGGVMGVLNVIAQISEAFGPRELALLTNVGAHLAVALERARLYDMVRDRRVREQAALLELSNQLLGRLDLDDVLEYVAVEARRLLASDASAILLPADGSELAFRAASGWLTDPVQAGVRALIGPQTGPGVVMATHEPLVLTDVREGPLNVCSWATDLLGAEGFRGHVLVPLIVDERAVGVLMLDSRRPGELSDDDLRLLRLIANQGALAIERARASREQVELVRLEHELTVAHDIQLGLLPSEMPTLDGWEFASHYEAARQVGGDFYDIFALPGDPRQYAIVVADVADKGVPAALIMAAGRTLLRGIAAQRMGPAAALRVANGALVEDGDGGLFVTALLGRLDAASGTFTFANAGHMRPLLIGANGQLDELRSDGIALGVIDDVSLQELQVTIAAGETIVLYTDGVVDGVNDAFERFGPRRLRDALGAGASDGPVSPREAVDAVRRALAAFVGAAEQADDLTLFAFGRTPARTE